MEDFLGELLRSHRGIPERTFPSRPTRSSARKSMPLLQVMLVVYVAYYGLQLFLGRPASAWPRSSAASSGC